MPGVVREQWHGDGVTSARIPGIERATGRPWDDWLRFLDGVGAAQLDHRAIAARVHEQLDGVVASPGWWAQSVAVAYEQHVGRRVPGQRADGTFEVSVSRSSALGTDELMSAWCAFAAADDAVGRLVGGDARVRRTDRRSTWRADGVDGSRVVVTSEPKKDGTASLVVTQTGLATREVSGTVREQWVGVLERFLGRR